MSEKIEIPDFPLFDVPDVEVALGADAARYFGPRGWDAAKGPCNKVTRALPAEERAFQSMFYGGKSMEQAGYRVRPELDEIKVARAMSALMTSWGVSQQQKTGTLALALHHWCEPIPASVDTHPEGGDANAAPFMSGVVPEGQTPEPSQSQSKAPNNE